MGLSLWDYVSWTFKIFDMASCWSHSVSSFYIIGLNLEHTSVSIWDNLIHSFMTFVRPCLWPWYLNYIFTMNLCLSKKSLLFELCTFSSTVWPWHTWTFVFNQSRGVLTVNYLEEKLILRIFFLTFSIIFPSPLYTYKLYNYRYISLTRLTYTQRQTDISTHLVVY